MLVELFLDQRIVLHRDRVPHQVFLQSKGGGGRNRAVRNTVQPFKTKYRSSIDRPLAELTEWEEQRNVVTLGMLANNCVSLAENCNVCLDWRSKRGRRRVAYEEGEKGMQDFDDEMERMVRRGRKR